MYTGALILNNINIKANSLNMKSLKCILWQVDVRYFKIYASYKILKYVSIIIKITSTIIYNVNGVRIGKIVYYNYNLILVNLNC